MEANKTSAVSQQADANRPEPLFNVNGRDFYLVRNHARWSVLEVGGNGKTVTGPVRRLVLEKFNEYRAANRTPGSHS